MSDVFISYARSTEAQARQVADALRALGHAVWRDDELPAHRAYTEVIEERLRAAKAVVVIWSPDAVKSQWVRAEANVAREAGTLVQLTTGGAIPPLPFNEIQCADIAEWSGDLTSPCWRKIIASIADLTGAPPTPAPSAPARAPPNKPSIAVLPFANLSNDPDQEYFTEGMVEEIVSALTRFKSIFVNSGVTLSLKGRALSPQDIGRQLAVRYVLEGSVRKAGARVRIAVKLLDTTDGAQVWGDRFEDTLEDVFALQDRVALSVAGAMEPAVLEEEIRRASRHPTGSVGAYDLYLRALPLQRTIQRAETLQCLELVERAVAIDPNFSAAWAVAALNHTAIVLNRWTDDIKGHRRLGVEAATRALERGGGDATVLARVAGALARLDQRLDQAAALIDRAVALNAGSAYIWFERGTLQVRRGDPDEAIDNFETARRLDPLSESNLGRTTIWTAYAKVLRGEFVEAVRLFDSTLFRPPFSFAVLAAAYAHLGQIELAREALAQHGSAAALPAEAFAHENLSRPQDRKLLLDGFALARS